MGRFIPYSKQEVGAREEQNHTLPVPWVEDTDGLSLPFPGDFLSIEVFTQ